MTYETPEVMLVGNVDAVVLGPTLTPPCDCIDDGYQGSELVPGLDG
jgi:hypothetical protein